MFKTKYRVVRDAFAGYEVQFKYWWSPFWLQVGFSNSHSSLKEAKEFIKKSKKPVVWAE
jgi:hypothetical protein